MDGAAAFDLFIRTGGCMSAAALGSVSRSHLLHVRWIKNMRVVRPAPLTTRAQERATVHTGGRRARGCLAERSAVAAPGRRVW